jgi:hypothetical protein
MAQLVHCIYQVRKYLKIKGNKMNFTKLAKNLSTAALLVSLSFSASAAKLFTVDEDPTNNFAANPGDLVVADGISGNYIEELTIQANGSFAATIFATFNGFTLGGFDIAGVNIGDTNNATGYTLYATLEAAGTAAPNPGGFFSLSGFSGNMSLWMDADNDTNYAFGSGTTNTADDVKIGTSSNSSGSGAVFSSSFGIFDILFSDFALADNSGAPFDGSEYFVAPSPFWEKATTTGTVSGLDFAAAPGTTQTISGVLNIAFVPEPTSIAILGLALVGFGATSRKKRLAK